MGGVEGDAVDEGMVGGSAVPPPRRAGENDLGRGLRITVNTNQGYKLHSKPVWVGVNVDSDGLGVEML